MATVSEAFAIALEHHRAGRLEVAEKIYQQILEVDPRHADATHLLGMMAGQAGNHALAAEYISRAIAIAPEQADFHVNLGEVYRALGNFPEAVNSFRRAMPLNLRFTDAYLNLGNALEDLGQLEEAAICYRKARELEPNRAGVHNNLGNVLKSQGQLAEAIACYRQAIELQPDHAGAYGNLGNVLRDQGEFAEAIACCRQALQLQPNFAGAHNNLGNVLEDLGQLEEALVCYQRAIELEPSRAVTHNNLGNVLKTQGKLEEAIVCFRQALQLQPNLAGVYVNLGNALKDQGQLTEAIACYLQALQLQPGYVTAQDNVLFILHHRSGITLEELAETHQEYERQHAAPLRSVWRSHDNIRDPNRRLRLGFISPDFHQHPVAFFLIRILENLDRDQYEIICYSDQIVGDKMTLRLQAAATNWRDVARQRDERLAEQIRADRIDILFDLSGHLAKNRLLVFARKPAPIQITWIGYIGTTGLKAMDYLLADRYEVPPSAEPYYSEKILRMPDGFLCYDPPDYAPAVSPLPALECGYITFGCFNNPAKITPQVVEVWSNILQRISGSRLVLKFRGFDDSWVSRHLSEMFKAHGVEPARIELAGQSPQPELLAQYGRIDLALDPFPCNGGTTTCDALWMGVPVITCPGETFANRLGLSHLSNVGLTELIADNLEDYVERAVALANDLPRLSALRASLRDRMAASPLCDGKRFAANLMPLLRDVWRQWVEASNLRP